MKVLKIIATLITGILLTITSCKESITEPEPQPGRRDYIWTVDTLDIFYLSNKIWGSSSTNVWSINMSPDFYHSIWHFDGNTWSTDEVFRLVSPHALWGFSATNIYLGGSSGGKIWRFDGSSWKQITELKKEGLDDIAIENIWGDSPDDFYVVGSGPDNRGYFNQSIIVHFTNKNWNILNTNGLIGDVVHLYKNSPDNKIYLRLTKIGGTESVDSTIIYEYTKGKYNRLYSSEYTKGLQADISIINDEVYFILGNEIARRVNDQFQTVLIISNSNFYHRIWGRNSKDIFLLMTDGLVHYNGSDMEYLFHFSHPNDTPWTQIFDAAIFKNEVFFTVYEPTTNLKLIYHGKLE